MSTRKASHISGTKSRPRTPGHDGVDGSDRRGTRPRIRCHIKRTQYYVRAIAKRLRATGCHPRTLSREYIDLVFMSVPLHEIGKAGFISTTLPVADVYDALISRRRHKPPFPHAESMAITRISRGTMFDPAVFDAFADIEPAIQTIAARYRDDAELVVADR